MKINLVLVTGFFAIVAGFLQYAIKGELKENGYKTHFFWGHWDDLPNFHDLIKQEQDPTKKERYQTLRFWFYLVLILMFASFVASIYFG